MMERQAEGRTVDRKGGMRPFGRDKKAFKVFVKRFTWTKAPKPWKVRPESRID